jgi:hypothetical protein
MRRAYIRRPSSASGEQGGANADLLILGDTLAVTPESVVPPSIAPPPLE